MEKVVEKVALREGGLYNSLIRQICLKGKACVS
jgi:hypothetical protein